jgi:hypothetical protein
MSAPTRRAALGALAGLPALALPSVAHAATSPTDDAELFALQPEIEAADREARLAIDAQEALSETYKAARPPRPVPPSPEEATVASLGEKGMELITRFRESLAQAKRRPPDPHELAELAWREECGRLSDECGMTAAEERASEAFRRVNAMSARLASIQATTPAGLIFKARFAAAHLPDEWDPDVMASIVEDLLAMGGDQAAGAEEGRPT